MIEEDYMKRWMVVVLVTICLALGAGSLSFADSGSDKVRAANCGRPRIITNQG